MFQYNFYQYLEALNVIVKADITDFEDYKLHHFELETVFRLDWNKAFTKEIIKVKDGSLNIFSRIRRKYLNKIKAIHTSLIFH